MLPLDESERSQALSLEGSSKIQPFLQSTFNQGWPQFSPDGRWVAYMSSESGRNEVYVQPYPGPGGEMDDLEGGAVPLWARSGREIFFRNGDNKMMSVAVETQPSFKASTPRMLFQGGN